jgi:hypothetical protein
LLADIPASPNGIPEGRVRRTAEPSCAEAVTSKNDVSNPRATAGAGPANHLLSGGPVLNTSIEKEVMNHAVDPNAPTAQTGHSETSAVNTG